MSLPNTNCPGDAFIVVCIVALTANAALETEMNPMDHVR